MIVISEKKAVVAKNSNFVVKPYDGKEGSWDPSTHAVFKDLIGQEAQSVVLSDQKMEYKIGGKKGSLDNLPFGTIGKIKVIFEIEKQR